MLGFDPVNNMFYSHDSSNVKLNNKPFPLKSEFTRTLTEPVIMVIMIDK